MMQQFLHDPSVLSDSNLNRPDDASLAFVIAISFIIWFLYGIYKGTPFFDKRDRNSSNETKNHEDDVQLPLQVSTPKDRFVITVGAVLYLMFPTLVARAGTTMDVIRMYVAGLALTAMVTLYVENVFQV